MIILRIILICLVLVIPFFIGVFLRKTNIIEAYLYGQMTMWAIFQIIAVPLVLLKISFNVLVTVYFGVMVVLTILGIRKTPAIASDIKKPKINILLVLALIIIMGQMMVYFVGMHLDEDDARWLAEANDAISKNTMLLNNPATGVYVGTFRGAVLKDLFSPWSMYIATLSKVTGVKVPVMAHTVMAPILLGISYLIYYRVAKTLFKGEIESSLFLLSISVINMFFGGNRHTQSFTSLIRIWQGKAIIASIMIPMLLLVFLIVQEDDTVDNWLWITVVGCASCLFSGMGIAISLLMISVYGLYTIVCGRMKRFPMLIMAMIPSLVFGFGYYMMRL